MRNIMEECYKSISAGFLWSRSVLVLSLIVLDLYGSDILDWIVLEFLCVVML